MFRKIFRNVHFSTLRIPIALSTCSRNSMADPGADHVSLFVVGDVMLARGIDMIHKYSVHPILYEGNNMDANDYVTLAERQNGKIPSKISRGIDYVWGDAIQILEEKRPDLKIINLETSITTCSKPCPTKGIHYRMHPKNVEVIKAAKVDCCTLANNHTADWGMDGLKETLKTLREAKINYVGAGLDIEEAKAPVVFNLGEKGRVLIFSGGHTSSGVPLEWKAKTSQEGVNVINSMATFISDLKSQVKKYKIKDDIIVLSIHWGGNWGFDLEPFMQKFAHGLIKEANVDFVYGHSSHHVKGIEVYYGKLIIYGCGDFINDYEGIGGQEKYRGDLSLMYFTDINPSNGQLFGLRMVPTEMKQLRVNRANETGIKWLEDTMSRECQKLGCDVKRNDQELYLIF